MKSNLFTNWDHLDWNRIRLVMAIVAAIWIGLAELIPQHYFKPVIVILTALQSGITVAIRGSVYVKDRTNLNE